MLKQYYQIDPKDSWMVAACEKNIPIIVPGWEDATLGNIFAAHCMKGDIKNVHTVRTGIEYMMFLADWYRKNSGGAGVGFFQIGGGIAGDFPICVVPMLRAGHGGIHAAVGLLLPDQRQHHELRLLLAAPCPNEKITWGKLAADTPKFIVESDATIVAPLDLRLRPGPIAGGVSLLAGSRKESLRIVGAELGCAKTSSPAHQRAGDWGSSSRTRSGPKRFVQCIWGILRFCQAVRGIACQFRKSFASFS